MKDVVVGFDPKHDGKDKDHLSKVLDQEIDHFNHFMATFPDFRAQGPLLPQEKFLLKTYLVHKINGKIDGAPEG